MTEHMAEHLHLLGRGAEELAAGHNVAVSSVLFITGSDIDYMKKLIAIQHSIYCGSYI